MEEMALLPVSTFSQVEEITQLPLRLTRLCRLVSRYCRRTLVLGVKVVAVFPILASTIEPVFADWRLSVVQKCAFVSLQLSVGKLIILNLNLKVFDKQLDLEALPRGEKLADFCFVAGSFKHRCLQDNT